VGGLESARVIGVAHALRVEVYAYLALGSSRKQRDVLHVVPELAEAGGVRLPFVDLPCILQGLRQLHFLGRRGSTVVRFSFFRLAIRSLGLVVLRCRKLPLGPR